MSDQWDEMAARLLSEPRLVKCATCDGQGGWLDDGEPSTCDDCGGKGEVDKAAERVATALRQADSAAFARGVGEEREACCKAVCGECAAGVEVYLADHGVYRVWRHRPSKDHCRADAIRRRAAKEEKT